MSRKTVSVTVSMLGTSLLALGLVLGVVQGCGSSSSNTTAVCNQVCNKVNSCTEFDGGPASAASMTACMATCAAQNCTNSAQLVSAANSCLAMSTCDAFLQCAIAAPKCQSGTGTGGTSGGGAGTSGGGAGTSGGGAGTSGSGGSSGTASCSICTKAQACCIAALQELGADAAACDFSATMCNAQTGTTQTGLITACSDEITAGQQLGLAACN